MGEALKIENDIYQIDTNHGILKNWVSLHDFIISDSKFSGDIPSRLRVRQWPWSQNLGEKSASAIIVALFRSNATQRDIPALKLVHYAILGVTE